ncbi:GNAT family N-acetyltransferase [Sphingomicrobium aestuariivivum]|uniref:GNAT family N-acetyltransferase n=1 Tax=Sphingomicrobium aestuariivivum TaxID=1582356 RepID=UPI001FD6F12E|nr:GNAT family N-acetyltransferase [Sphingomicrobium aestuariivivum]MCJ8190591.1 GNAT family N-acetyltransferase [Sphingomicrobium aestuariivivum]
MGRAFRRATPADDETLGEVMYDAVRNGRSHYSEKQRAAWVPEPRKGAAWSERLAKQDIVIAEEAGEVLGFMSLERDTAYLDFAYIRPKAQGTGLFRQMLERILERGRAQGMEQISVHASLMAQPAFAACGFAVTAEEEVTIADESFRRFAMTCTL